MSIEDQLYKLYANDAEIITIFQRRQQILSNIYASKPNWSYDDYWKASDITARYDSNNPLHQVYNLACSMILVRVLQSEIQKDFDEIKILSKAVEHQMKNPT